MRRPARELLAGLACAALLAATPVLAQENLPAEAQGQGGVITAAWPQASATVPASVAAFGDELNIMDRLEVRLAGMLAAPEGSTYRVWLRSDEKDVAQHVGDLPATANEFGVQALTYRQPGGETLLLQFSEVLVTQEPAGPLPSGARPGPVVLAGQIDPGALVHTRRLLVRWPDSRYGTASLQGLRRMAHGIRGQAAIMREAANGGDLDGMRRKAEHVANMIEGQGGGSFGDHNGDGRAEDPGDGVGLLNYAAGALSQTQFAWATATGQQVAEEALAVQPPVQVALAWAGFTRDLSLELARTTDPERATDLAGHVLRATYRVAAAVDPAGDIELQWTLDQLAEEFGTTVTPAYAEAQALVHMPLLPPGTAKNTAGASG